MHRSVFFIILQIALAFGNDLCKCDPKLVEKLQQHWTNSGGPPKKVTSHHDPMTFIKGTESKFSKNAKCDYFYFTKDGKISDLSKKRQEPLHECDGIITYARVSEEMYSVNCLTSFETVLDSKSYVIYFKNGVYARYRCVDNGPEVSATNLPEVAIAKKDKASETDVNDATNVVTNLGVTIKPYAC